ncbi:hypothetical protein P153DRAFT_361909 [Dothidotthia symphoricarpi CBS 119687]|uniref:Uncharacterized protein n=1 Tax=Dothidotthia symphoricarpi CBS 119687 TaxID=1392245 RepID=A0A6A5ZXE0_9PLEO|nr:uncharacterized protein P153DRAFT_361909 [Dothidotthia symphoricarpi CBS 119687]KAF2123584.1 hypothetical protein P153DRAFT_361909 [Dothidotthia symphoricarpi CBS 119687]
MPVLCPHFIDGVCDLLVPVLRSKTIHAVTQFQDLPKDQQHATQRAMDMSSFSTFPNINLDDFLNSIHPMGGADAPPDYDGYLAVPSSSYDMFSDALDANSRSIAPTPQHLDWQGQVFLGERLMTQQVDGEDPKVTTPGDSASLKRIASDVLATPKSNKRTKSTTVCLSTPKGRSRQQRRSSKWNNQTAGPKGLQRLDPPETRMGDLESEIQQLRDQLEKTQRKLKQSQKVEKELKRQNMGLRLQLEQKTRRTSDTTSEFPHGSNSVHLPLDQRSADKGASTNSSVVPSNESEDPYEEHETIPNFRGETSSAPMNTTLFGPLFTHVPSATLPKRPVFLFTLPSDPESPLARYSKTAQAEELLDISEFYPTDAELVDLGFPQMD